MKRTIFKIVLVALVVFFALPVIFEGEDAGKPGVLASASAQTEEDDDLGLPVIRRNSAIPLKSENFMTKYAAKLKRFYRVGAGGKRVGAVSSATQEELYAYVNNDEYNNYISSVEEGSDEIVRNSFISVGDYAGGPASPVVSSSAAVKQVMHGSAPVSGLYESSATDSYTSKVQAKEVYSKVMRRVDRKAPNAASAKSAPATAERAVNTVVSNKRAAVINNNEGQLVASAPESKYVGIASKNPDSSSASGRYNGFGSNNVSGASSGGSANGNYGNFETAAQNVNTQVEKISGGAKRFTVTRNTSSPSGSGPSAPATPGAPVTPGTPTTPAPDGDNPNPGQGNQPGPDNPGNPPTGGDPANPEEGKPTPKPEPGEKFDKNDWRNTDETICRAGIPSGGVVVGDFKVWEAPGSLSENKNTENDKTQHQDSDKPKIDPKDIIPPDDCMGTFKSGVTLPKDKYKYIVDLGEAEGGYVTPKNSIISGRVLEKMVGDYVQNGKPLKDDVDFVVIPEKTFKQQARSKDVIILSVQKKPYQGIGATGEARTIHMQRSQLETYSGVDFITEEINKVPAKVSKVEKELIEQAKKRKENISAAVKTAQGTAAGK